MIVREAPVAFVTRVFKPAQNGGAAAIYIFKIGFAGF
jgi:hypothetical protein